MSKTRILLAFLSFIIFFQGFDAQAQETKHRWEIQRLITKEKVAVILPKAMRANKIDMWILVNKHGRSDPLTALLGGGGSPSDKYYKNQFVGYLVFTDRGGDTMERASLGEGIHDANFIEFQGLLPTRGDLKKFVEERDPKRIAVNMSDYLGLADGLSHTGYKALVKDLGKKYAARLVSSERLVSDFGSWKVAGEIALFSDSIRLAAHLVGRALSNEVIKPGVTTLGDIAFWVADQRWARGYAARAGRPRIMYPKMPTTKDGRQIVKPPTGPYDRVIQRGDFIGWDGGGGADIERYAYVLREGETDLPKLIKEIQRHAVKVRNACRKIAKPGRTGLETLHLMWSKMKELGYEIQEIEDKVTDSPNIEVCIGWHSVAGPGPRIWTDKEQPFASSLMVKTSQLFAFEMFIYYPIPEWGGKKMRFDIEENVIITEHGVGLFVPTHDEITLIY